MPGLNTVHGATATMIRAGLLTLLTASVCAAMPPLVSTFEADAEGWIVRDLNCTNYSPIAIAPSTWISDGGFPGGYLSAEDPSSNCFFFEAPPSWAGDRSAFIGKSLRFAIRASHSDYPQGAVVVLVGGGLTLVHAFAVPTPAWDVRAVPLVATAFKVGTAGGPTATATQLQTALSSLQFLRISGEFGAIVVETSDLDCVRFGVDVCAADLNGDGVVDGADLGALLSAWGTNHPTADLTCDATVDGADLGALLQAWGGCR